MDVEFDPAKRLKTLRQRALDFADAIEVFAGRVATRQDTRSDYAEARFVTAGYLHGRFVVLVWTQRGAARRIISMRHGHEQEERAWRDALG